MPPGSGDGALRIAERDLIRERFRFFAVAWCGSSLLWLFVLVPGQVSALTWAEAATAAGAQTVALAVAVWVALRTESPAVARAATLAGLAIAGLVWTVAIGAGGGPLEILVFALQTLFLGAPLFFAWSWRAELLLIVTVVGLGSLWLRAVGMIASVLDVVPVALVGGTIALLLTVRVRRDFCARVRLREQGARAQQALAESHQAYRALAESARDFIWTCDLDGRLTYVNEAIVRFSGRPPGSLIGVSVAGFLTDHPANAALGPVESFAEGSPSVVMEVNTPRGRRWFEALVAPIHEVDGRVTGLRGITRDVTERMAAERALRESEERYRGIVESQHALVLRFDLAGHVTFINDVGCATIALAREQILGRSFLAWVHAEDEELVQDTLRRLAVPPFKETILSRVRAAQGTRWFEWETSAILDERGAPSEYQGVGRDVTERREADEALRRSLVELRRREEQLRLLAQRQVVVREEERRRLGFDLHDDVCQELVGIGILVESVRRRLRPTDGDELELLARIGRHLGALSEHLRLLARELRPMLLHDLGLEDSLRSLAGGMSAPATQVVAVFPTAIPRLDEETEVAVYRVAQEALTNALRHAHATHVTISLATTESTLQLEVRDDGRGFDLAERHGDALGLVSMEERALALGGRVEVVSGPGQGTTVRFVCPQVAEKGPSVDFAPVRAAAAPPRSDGPRARK